MPNKRYKILDGALDYLAFGNEATDVTLPAGSPLRKFQEWRNNERKVTYNTTNWGKVGELIDVNINPFALPANEEGKIIVPMSKRAYDFGTIKPGYDAGGLTKPDVLLGSRIRDITPAKCTISVPNASLDKTNEPSKLTGIPYTAKGRASYTFPYGKKTGTTLELEVRAAITSAVSGVAGVSLQFESERI